MVSLCQLHPQTKISHACNSSTICILHIYELTYFDRTYLCTLFSYSQREEEKKKKEEKIPKLCMKAKKEKLFSKYSFNTISIYVYQIVCIPGWIILPFPIDRLKIMDSVLKKNVWFNIATKECNCYLTNTHIQIHYRYIEEKCCSVSKKRGVAIECVYCMVLVILFVSIILIYQCTLFILFQCIFGISLYAFVHEAHVFHLFTKVMQNIRLWEMEMSCVGWCQAFLVDLRWFSISLRMFFLFFSNLCSLVLSSFYLCLFHLSSTSARFKSNFLLNFKSGKANWKQYLTIRLLVSMHACMLYSTFWYLYMQYIHIYNIHGYDYDTLLIKIGILLQLFEMSQFKHSNDKINLCYSVVITVLRPCN